MVLIIAAYRDILLHGAWPDWADLGYVWLVSLPILLLAIAIFRRFERHYPKMML
jgi:lipopolysaccharide transport system permease protein